jgi:hypothetical protein
VQTSSGTLRKEAPMATVTNAVRGSLLRRLGATRRLNAIWAIGTVLSLIALNWGPAHAQSSSHLRCQGRLFGAPAAIEGVRLYQAYNALGDGEVRFDGIVAMNGMTCQIVYGGYTNVVPFEGRMNGPQGSMKIAVLDKTGGRMLIYNGRATLKAPDTIGEFICAWT